MELELATNEDIMNELKNRPNEAHLLFVLNEKLKIDLSAKGKSLHVLTLLTMATKCFVEMEKQDTDETFTFLVFATKYVAEKSQMTPQEVLEKVSWYFDNE
jgi:hypothetical protein